MPITKEDIIEVKKRLQIGTAMEIKLPTASERKNKSLRVDATVKQKYNSYFLVEYLLSGNILKTSFNYQELKIIDPPVRIKGVSV